MVLKAWSLDQQHQQHLETGYQCKFSGPAPPTDSETLRVRYRNLCVNKPCRWIQCMLQFEGYLLRLEVKAHLVLLRFPNNFSTFVSLSQLNYTCICELSKILLYKSGVCLSNENIQSNVKWEKKISNIRCVNLSTHCLST